MTATSFNPLATARGLEAAGVERRQAEAIAEGIREAAAGRADLATKADLVEVRNELRANLAEIRAEIHRKTETLRSEMRWMLAFQGALILAIAGRLFGIV